MKRLLLAAVTLIAAVAITAALVGTGAATSSAQAAAPAHGLFASVALTKHLPMPACSPDGSDCTAANRVDFFAYIANLNPLTPLAISGQTTRATLQNAFVVSSIDETVYANGAVLGQGTFTPPPNLTGRFGTAGHWPSTVTCGQPPTVPCNVVASPAILPGERTAIFYDGWIHLSNEPNGTYLFQFTVHGTLNGTPVDLSARSLPIQMTA